MFYLIFFFRVQCTTSDVMHFRSIVVLLKSYLYMIIRPLFLQLFNLDFISLEAMFWPIDGRPACSGLTCFWRNPRNSRSSRHYAWRSRRRILYSNAAPKTLRPLRPRKLDLPTFWIMAVKASWLSEWINILIPLRVVGIGEIVPSWL